jgi:beta-mannosidase
MKIQIEINKNWRFRQAGKDEWLPAHVPGTVHTDLLANKKIEDPFHRTNEKDQQWIDKVDWEYKTYFTVDNLILKKERVELLFEGLDTYADVYINGSRVLSGDNMFRLWGADCKSLLRKGENEIKIYFHSPVKIDLPKLEKLGYLLPAVNDQSENGGLEDKKISVFARKAGYHYGWDWGPRFVTMGIWRNVFIQAWDSVKISEIQIIQKEVSKEKATMSAVFEIESTKEINGNASVRLGDEPKTVVQKEVRLKQGTNFIEWDFEIKNPKLWWCNGLGEPHLYLLIGTVELGGKICDKKQMKIGIRTIKVVREKDEAGKSFYFELNGVQVFAKGANYIPNDNFLPRTSNQKYEHIVKSAVQANMNMLRVWGGGIYENKIFYDLCDFHGILVWQDFMFACTMYPGDEAFLKNVRQEAIQNVKRLRNHPCLALWCGNNEIDVAWSHDSPDGWGWKEQFPVIHRDKIWKDYENIFHELLPELVEKHDPKTFYWPSSPLADFGVRSTDFSTSGDMHYWGVWHGKEPFSQFKKIIPRFMSEYGFQSFPEFKTVKAFSISKDWHIQSEVMSAHQRSEKGNQLIKEYMGDEYRIPQNFQSMLYLGQVLQAEAVKLAIEAHRRNKPYCMGSLYWQINDCWPVASWSSIDYFGRWKALHYFVKKAFKDVLVSPTIDNETLNVFVISDRLESLKADLVLKLIDFSGNVKWQKNIAVTIAANSSKIFYESISQELLTNVSKKSVFLWTTLVENDNILSENILYFLPVKELDLPPTNITTSVTKIEKGCRIKLTSNKLAKNVFLHIDEIDGFFSDNYFDLLPGVDAEIDFTCEEEINNISDNLKIVTIRDTYRIN